MQNKSQKYLLYKYLSIRDKWYKKETNNTGEVGIKIEKLLGKTGGDFNIPDFNEYEIKCIKKYTTYNELCLFTAAPYGETPFPIQTLAQKYGWPDIQYKESNRISGIVEYEKYNKLGKNYQTKLILNKKRIYIQIYNTKKELIEEKIYWDIEELNIKLKRKMKNLALIKYKTKKENNMVYIKYENIDFYQLKENINIEKLIKNRTIYFKINYGIKKSGKYKGKHIDHGTTIVVNRENIENIFDKE